MSSIAQEVRNVKLTTLPNGLRIATEAMPHVRSLSVGIWIGTGSRRETPGESGLSHFIEHMLFKGTSTRSAEDIARLFDTTGGHMDAFTAKELVSYNTKVLDEHLPLAFDVLSDMVLNPAFRDEDIAKEKGVILEELKAEADNPEYLVHEIFSSHFFKNHSLGRPILGTPDTVQSFNQASIRDYWGRCYVPSNTLITAAGSLAHDNIVELAGRYFGHLPAPETATLDAPPVAHPKLVLKRKKSLEQVHLCLGVPAYPLADKRRYGCFVLNTILGGGMSSRLFQNVREREGLAYSVFSELNLYRDAGWLAVYAGTSTATLARVIDMVIAEFRSLKREPVPAEELKRAKDHLKGSIVLGMESTSSRMSNLARQELYFKRFIGLDEVLDSINAVTAEEVQAMATDLFDPGRIALAALGNLNAFKIERERLAC
jgi:predicted Zn-dependent peptidase